ncbi:MAG: hypothetical protein OES46_21780 [Gammaproteobacteria bacterium]|nr:hypothetical protein [Gammaproteobacteria bacterium]
MNTEQWLFHVDSKGWYVRTLSRVEGPFATEDEAATYLALLERVSAARVACSWPIQSQ